jgi:signal peptidase
MRTIRNVLFYAAVAAGLAFATLLVIVPKLGHYETYVITGRSMTGTIDRGALTYSRPVPVAELRVGDIITFEPPGIGEPVTHRIIAVTLDQDGSPIFRTQGDNVPSPDPWQAVPTTPRVPCYALQFPLVGYVVALLAIPLVKLCLLLIPAIIVAGSILVRVWREAGDEVAGTKPAAAQPNPWLAFRLQPLGVPPQDIADHERAPL